MTRLIILLNEQWLGVRKWWNLSIERVVKKCISKTSNCRRYCRTPSRGVRQHRRHQRLPCIPTGTGRQLPSVQGTVIPRLVWKIETLPGNSSPTPDVTVITVNAVRISIFANVLGRCSDLQHCFLSQNLDQCSGLYRRKTEKIIYTGCLSIVGLTLSQGIWHLLQPRSRRGCLRNTVSWLANLLIGFKKM